MRAQRLAETRPAPRARCSTSRACRSRASGPSAPGPPACRCRSTAWTRTSSSPRRATDAAREIVAALGSDLAELYTYPGDAHLFADRTLASYDAQAAALLTERTPGVPRPRLVRYLALRETARMGLSPRVVAAVGIAALLAAVGLSRCTAVDHAEGDAEVMATGLEVPWGLSFLPTGDALVGERMTGDIYEIPADGGEPTLVGTVPDVEALGEGGLLGHRGRPAVHPRLVRLRLPDDRRPTTGSCGSGSSRTSRDLRPRGDPRRHRQGGQPQRRRAGVRARRHAVRRRRRRRQPRQRPGPRQPQRQDPADDPLGNPPIEDPNPDPDSLV